MDGTNCYLGIDPGRDKTGVALLDAKGVIFRTEVLPTQALKQELIKFLQGLLPKLIILGNGTNSLPIQQVVSSIFPQVSLVVIEESYSTEEARSLYWRLNPPTGWRKLVPLGLLLPPINLDGYAAAVLVQRYLEQ